MPSDTFFNLSQEKKDRLLHAAKVEFSKHSLAKASISQIIKGANIPRGSFYQYFTDKEDLYFYYFSLLKKKEKLSLEQAIEQTQGDLFLAIEHYFSSFLDTILHGPDNAFYAQLFSGMDFHSSEKIMAFHHHPKRSFQKEKKMPHHSFLQKVDLKCLHLNNTKELFVLFKLMMIIFFTTINEMYTNEQTNEEKIKEQFQLRLNWLKFGVLTKKG